MAWIDGKDDENTSDGEEWQSRRRNGAHNTSPFFVVPYIYIYILLRSVYLWCLQSYTSPEYGHIFTPDHWACYEQLRTKMKVLKIVSIKLESNKQRYHKPCLIFLLAVVVRD